MLSKQNHNSVFISKIIIIFIIIFMPLNLYADELKKIRIKAGLDLFPSLIAADSEINQKKNINGKLQLLIIYKNKKRLAEEMASNLRLIKKIRNVDIIVNTCRFAEIDQYKTSIISGIFITQQSKENLKQLINFGILKNSIVFSPFPGDVEKGVSGGLIISDIIQPFLNPIALEKASITIKPFFLQVVKLYE